MTIFGFNTDVKVGDVVYHVQSEARQADMLLQTMVFLKGQCVSKRAVSYAHKAAEPDFSEQAMQEFLKSQHKAVIEAVQQGRLESIGTGEGEIQDAGSGGLTLNWVNSSQVQNGQAVSMVFQVLDEGKQVPNAVIGIYPSSSANHASVAKAVTDGSGNATVSFSFTPEMLQDSAVIARATQGGKSATRRFRFKK